MNIKYSIPCEKCSSLLLPFTNKETKVFFYFNQEDIKFELNFNQISELYKPFGGVISREEMALEDFLVTNTKLNNVDRLLLS